MVDITQTDIDAWEIYGPKIFHCEMTGPEALAAHRATRTDATSVAVEMVAELQLSAFLAGRGSIRTKANGNTHESSPGPTMDDYRRMARFALAEGQVDATPVAWMPIDSAPKDGTRFLAWCPDAGRVIMRIDGVHRETWAIDPSGRLGCDPTLWQPLPAAPDHIEEPRAMAPATDVAALVEAAKRCIQIVERHNHRQNEKVEDVKLILSAALAPFTKGRNDELV